MRVAATLFAVAWGGNQFLPLLVMYRLDEHFSAFTVNVLLAAYVVGLVPGLLIGGPLSDRYGRRSLLLPAPLIGAVGSLVLALGTDSVPLLALGRVLSGVAIGLGMAVGTSWIKELSSPRFEPKVSELAGAKRASFALTIGFGMGAAVAATLAQFAPWPGQLSYLINIVVSVVAFILLLPAPETHASNTVPGRLLDDLKIPSAFHRRFLYVVAPTAPWVFGTAASSYAVQPALLASQVPGFSILLAGLMSVLGLTVGAITQLTVGPRLDHPGSSRGLTVAMAATILGMLMAATTALTLNVWIGIASSAVLGFAFGLLVLGGLLEVQRIAGPADLAGLTAVFYSISYVGFLVPAVLAALADWVSYSWMFAAGALIATACLAIVVIGWSRHLPEPFSPDPESQP